jgi:hypothetical protein
MTTTAAPPIPKVSVEVWLTLLMLHESHPDKADFSIEEIMNFAQYPSHRKCMGGPLRPGFYAHVVQHCVANRPPSPARYRMLLETSPGRRRLFRPGDPYHPGRAAGKSVPEAFEDFPDHWFNDALQHYNVWCQKNAEDLVKNDPLLSLYGSGKDLWADEHADEYIRRLREGWE